MMLNSGTNKGLLRTGRHLTVILIAFAMLMSSFMGTGLSTVWAADSITAAQNENQGRVSKKTAKRFAKKVEKANRVDRILKNHSSFSFSANGYELWIDSEKVFYDDNISKYSRYADDDLFCELEEEQQSSFNYVVDTDNRGDKYAYGYAYYFVDKNIIADYILEDKHISLVNDGKTITYLGKLSKKNVEVFKNNFGITADIKEAYSRVVVKADTYEILEWASYSKGNEENPEYLMQFAYDTEEPAGCRQMRRMAHRAERNMVNFTVIRDEGTQKEYRKQLTIPQNSGVIVYAYGTDGLYTDAGFTKAFEKWNRKSDITLYCRSLETGDGEAADSENTDLSLKLNEQYEKLLPDLGSRLDEWNSEFAKCSEAEKRIMQYYFITTSMSELCSIDFSLLHSYASHAVKLRESMPWTKALDEETFLCYVAAYKVFREPVVDCRPFFYEQIAETVKGRSLTEAALLVNYWCGTQASYGESDQREASPIGMYNGGTGRCGEESNFVVNVLRSVGIPARVCNVTWTTVADGHAFVQVLVDGEWHYMGACEPDPVLDSGWFTGRLGSLITTISYSFSDIGLGQSYTTEDGYYMINGIADFTDTRTLTVTVLDKDGKPAADVRTELVILQQDSFFSTMGIAYTGKNGKVSYETGKGSVYVIACMDGDWRGIWINKDKNKATISFAEEPECDTWNAYAVSYNDAGPKKAQTFTDEDRVALFGTVSADEVRAQNHAGDFDAKRAAAYPDCEENLRNAGRNFNELITFLEKDDDPLRSVLVKGLTSKYTREVKAEVLEDILQGAKNVRGDLSDEAFINGILYPAVEWSYFTPQRLEVQKLFTKKQLKAFRKDPSKLKEWFAANISDNCIRENKGQAPSLIDAIKMGYCPDNYRTDVLMELARAVGIPVYEDEYTFKWWYYGEKGWVQDVWSFDADDARNKQYGGLQYIPSDNDSYLGKTWSFVGPSGTDRMRSFFYWLVEDIDTEEMFEYPVGDYVMLYMDAPDDSPETGYMRRVRIAEGKTAVIELP